MSEIDIILILPGLLLVVFVIIAQGYWTEAREFYAKAQNNDISNNNHDYYIENYHRALIMFRINSLGMLLCLLSAIIPIFFLNNITILIAKLFLVVAFLILFIFLIFMISGRFFIKMLKLEYPRKKN
jgi:hypothetical protein